MEQLRNKSIAAMVLGIVSVVFALIANWAGLLIILALAAGIVGLILALQVRKAYANAGAKPDGMATAGLICSIIGLALSVIICIVLIVAACVACYSLAALGSAFQSALQ